jgi:putative flippase GtrA
MNLGIKEFVSKYKKLFIFLLVGFINTLFGYTIYVLLVINNFDYKAAITISTIIGVIFNYISTGRFVFKYNRFNRIIPFISVYTLIYLVNLLLITFFLNIGFNELLSGAFALMPVVTLTFYLLNKYVYYDK